MDFKIIDGGVCAPKGFKANGVYCGIKKSASAEQNPNVPHKNDLGMIVSDEMCTCAAVYTTNKVKGAPILVTKSNLEKTNNHAKAVIVNSKNANTCNADGVEKASRMCELAAEALGIDDSEVVVASTGVIGQILPIEPIEKGIKPLVDGLSYTGNEEAATAIMTTDTIKKEYAVEFSVNEKTCRVGGMAKGSGMIHPNMATTLNFITSDVNISAKMLQAALDDIVKVTYNCLSIDGDTSTNDMVSVMANGLAGNDEIISEGEEFSSFKTALYEVMMNLTKMLAKDGEGASKMIECECKGCADKGTAITVAKSVVGSTLFKCAVFGEDANWGRILCAVGYAPAEFDINKVDVDIKSEFGEIAVCRNGAGVDFSEEKAAEVLKSDEIYVIIDLNAGESSAKAWGCDLTYDYVKINGDYRT